MDAMEAIYSRSSVRSYTAEPVGRDELLEIIRAGSRAPSGLNNQPWRFVVVMDRGMLDALAGLTRYRHILQAAPSAIAVFCDRHAMYNDVKDHQSIGACLQNMLLAAHAKGLGAVWLGEILKSSEEVRTLFGLGEEMELMAVLAIGHPDGRGHGEPERKPVEALILKEV
jgi:nitroreductase